MDFWAEREDFGEDENEVAVVRMTMAEVGRQIRQHPNLRPIDFPEDYQLAMGRQMESALLQTTFRAEREGEGGFLPLP